MGILLASCWPDDKKCEAYFIMLYLRGAFWFVTVIIDHYAKHHHEKLRLNGYHDFHKETNVHKGIPFYVVSLWNSTILTVQALMQQYYGNGFGEACVQSVFSPVIYITMFNIAENIVLAGVIGSYICKLNFFLGDSIHYCHSLDIFVTVVQTNIALTHH